MSQEKNKNLKEFTNLYELSKTLRFELKPSKKIEFDNGDIQNLVKQFKKIQESFLNIFIYEYKEEKLDSEKQYSKLEFQEKREIKYGWLRNYTKNSFYDLKKRKNIKDKKRYFLTEIDYLENEFLRWINEWKESTQRLEELTNTQEHEKERKSDIAFVLRGFLKRQNFSFIKEFTNAVVDIQGEKGIESDKKITEFRELLKNTQKNLKDCEKEYLSSQSRGVLLHKASLNYYTLNKTPKAYEELKDAKEKKLEDNLPRYIFNRTKFNQKTRRKDVLFTCDESWLIEVGIGTDIYNLTLDEAYQKIKDWKAKQKSDFNEAVAGNKLTINNFRKEFPLFDSSDENFEIFYELTKDLDSNPENAKEIAQNRGKFFNAPQEEIQTKNYYEMCELYKRIAMERGKIIAEIKGIENEEVQSQLLNHWAVILREGKKRSVIMIPRKKDGDLENHKEAHNFVEKEFDKEKNEGEIVLYHFKSLTLRALEKLCFKEVGNTFAPELKKEIGSFSFPRYKEEWRDQPEKLIQFYKQVLQSEYAKKYLDLFDFDELSESFKDLQDFESKLEKAYYVKVPLKISVEQKENFIIKFDAKVFEMTTRSIEGNKKENAHALIWKNFWSEENENNITRLNPEMSVFYRKALDIREGNKNRFSKPRFTLATTITLNATKRKSNLAFKTTEDISDHIKEFNNNFNDEFKGEWFYGIDRGLKELATLCITKFTDEKYQVNEKEFKKPEFAKIEVWKLKDENADLKDKEGNVLKNIKGEDRKIIDNISCLEKIDEDLFEKSTTGCIDLTMAKLIKGKIVLNGDKKTYLKLKEISAKRRLWELFSHSKIDKDSKIDENKMNITKRDGAKHKFYWLTKEQKESQKEKENIKQLFEDYLKKLADKNAKEDIELIEKINHLRDAITANMVGIIVYLQKQFSGIIALENMKAKEHIEKHRDQSNENISRRLEWALYRRFQTEGFVPPQIKQSIFIRDEFSEKQFGIVKFVKIEDTSKNCPRCENTYQKTGDHYVCEKKSECGFFSRDNRLEFEPLDNSDKVGAFNVAKNAFNKIYS